MTPERWQVVKDVFQAALRRDERQRPAYLDHACAGDPSLRADVDAMLASDERAGSFLEEPVRSRTRAGCRGGRHVASRIDDWPLPRPVTSRCGRNG